MNMFLRDAEINLAAAGGTTADELGALAKPSMYTYADRTGQFSHGSVVTGIHGMTGRRSDFDDAKKAVLEQALKKPLHELPEMEVAGEKFNPKKGIGYLQGSEFTDVEDYDTFKKNVDNFRQTHKERLVRAEQNKHMFGRGAETIFEELTKGPEVLRNKGRRISSKVSYPIIAFGAGLAGAAAYNKSKDKKPLTKTAAELPKVSEADKKTAVAGAIAGAGAIFIVKSPHTYQFLKSMKEFNPQRWGFKNMKEAVTFYVNSRMPDRSELGKKIRQLKKQKHLKVK